MGACAQGLQACILSVFWFSVSRTRIQQKTRVVLFSMSHGTFYRLSETLHIVIIYLILTSFQPPQKFTQTPSDPLNFVFWVCLLVSYTLSPCCHMPFTQEWILFSHSLMKAWLIESRWDGCPSRRFSHPYRGLLKLCYGGRCILGHVPDQGPSYPVTQFGWTANSRKSTAGSKFLQFHNYWGHCAHWNTQRFRNGSIPLHHHNTEFLGLHDLVFVMTCSVNCGTLHIQVCVFCKWCPVNYICHSWTHLKDNYRMHLIKICSATAKGLNICIKDRFQFLKFLKTCFHFVSMGYWV